MIVTEYFIENYRELLKSVGLNLEGIGEYYITDINNNVINCKFYIKSKTGQDIFRTVEQALEEYDYLIKILDIAKKRKKERVYRYISKLTRYEVLKRQDWNCNICHCKLKYSISNQWEGKVAHIDHIHPFSKRESYVNGIDKINEISNLQALCPDCNLKKSKKEVN